MDFIQEVQMKTSGIEAEYGGALGGVVNVVMKKGGNEFHGSFFTTYESVGMDANPRTPSCATIRWTAVTLLSVWTRSARLYRPKKDHFRTVQPGFTVGGPIVKDRLWFFPGFAPLFKAAARTVELRLLLRQCNRRQPVLYAGQPAVLHYGPN